MYVGAARVLGPGGGGNDRWGQGSRAHLGSIGAVCISLLQPALPLCTQQGAEPHSLLSTAAHTMLLPVLTSMHSFPMELFPARCCSAPPASRGSSSFYLCCAAQEGGGAGREGNFSQVAPNPECGALAPAPGCLPPTNGLSYCSAGGVDGRRPGARARAPCAGAGAIWLKLLC